jgi:hypothetical protein
MVKYLAFLRGRVNVFVCVFWTFVAVEILKEPGFHPIALGICGLCMAFSDWLVDRVLYWYGIPRDYD